MSISTLDNRPRVRRRPRSDIPIKAIDVLVDRRMRGTTNRTREYAVISPDDLLLEHMEGVAKTNISVE